jgi:D-aminopeptidase
MSCLDRRDRHNLSKPGTGHNAGVRDLHMLPNDSLNVVFEATVAATEEAIVNAMVAARDMSGVDGHRVSGLPHDRLREILRKYKRLTP